MNLADLAVPIHRIRSADEYVAWEKPGSFAIWANPDCRYAPGFVAGLREMMIEGCEFFRLPRPRRSQMLSKPY